MPNIDEGAKEFELARAGWFGDAVSLRRKALNLSASELSRRTDELGYPISRAAIAKIESNLRSGKIDVAEVLVLGAALDIPPVLLLFPQFATDGGGAVLPNVFSTEDEAVRWLSGHVSWPHPYGSLDAPINAPHALSNEGVRLIAAAAALEEALDARIALVHHLERVSDDAAETGVGQRMLDKNLERIEALREQVRDARTKLWGTHSMRNEGGDASDG
ncbi:helix-turn-helix domain-containing protein [Mycobacterium marinum]|uniref:helix-turn-helix domain-containing protein n=1 Tax=Mycobacterium marinum TaxID=1781 RepID=UPI000358D8E1|nr:helix-turn-helix transcriptional regulator [Mycobacterium marinum]EPQ72839.1 putative DNA-binding protein [Mycobacterium marinum str. Europe]